MKHNDYIDNDNEHHQVLFDLGLITDDDDYELFVRYIDLMVELDMVEDKDYEKYLALRKVRKNRLDKI